MKLSRGTRSLPSARGITQTARRAKKPQAATLTSNPGAIGSFVDFIPLLFPALCPFTGILKVEHLSAKPIKVRDLT
jgi:hypothetical protein